MSATDILKLIFHHDQRLSELSKNTVEDSASDPLSLFTKPDPTFSSFYFSGTDLEHAKFGLNNLEHSGKVMEVINAALSRQFQQGAEQPHMLRDQIESMQTGSAARFSKKGWQQMNALPEGETVRALLERGDALIIKKNAEHGFDIQILMMTNIYTLFFYPLQQMLPHAFRFFSINGKRLKNEKYFYFETWSLSKPPHGFEEVFPESVL